MRSNGDITDDGAGDQTDAQMVDPTYVRAKVPVAEAARLLGMSAEAVRSRIARGTLDSVKESGKVFVLLDPAQTRQNGAQTADLPADLSAKQATERMLVDSLRDHNCSLEDQVDHLRRELEVRNEELRRKDTILMAMTQRIPELEPSRESGQAPAQEAPGAREEAVEAPGKAEAPEAAEGPQTAKSRPWWLRIIGG